MIIGGGVNYVLLGLNARGLYNTTYLAQTHSLFEKR